MSNDLGAYTLPCPDTKPHDEHTIGFICGEPANCPGVRRPPITLAGDDLAHVFDLAVSAVGMASDSFDSEDTEVMRRLAVLLGVDPESITPDEFVTQYPHRYVLPEPFDARVRTVREYGRFFRDETHEEFAARRAASEADSCHAGTYGRLCGLPRADPKHTGAAS